MLLGVVTELRRQCLVMLISGRRPVCRSVRESARPDVIARGQQLASSVAGRSSGRAVLAFLATLAVIGTPCCATSRALGV